MKVYRAVLVLIAFGLPSLCPAQQTDGNTVVEMEQQLERLNKVNFHPNLLPIILGNADFIELTDEQVGLFKKWGKANFRPMVAVMNNIIRKRNEFQEYALSPTASAAVLKEKQEEIFELHRKLLEHKLSCRKNIARTFTAQNWEAFMIVLGEKGFPIPDSTDNTHYVAATSSKTGR